LLAQPGIDGKKGVVEKRKVAGRKNPVNSLVIG